jgi:hypothetical protein
LGAGGTLVVAVVYAALFALAARLLSREGFRTASGLATLLVVGMTPVTAWALLSLLDLWPVSTPGWGGNWTPAGPWNASGWLAVDLTVILAALVALRRVRFGLLALPIAIALGCAGLHLTQALFVESEHDRFMTEWANLVSGTVILAIGYALDRRRERASPDAGGEEEGEGEGAEDFARWFYVVGLVVLQLGLVEVWSQLEVGRHWLPVVALLQIATALQLRRRSWLAAGAVNVAWYVGFLAADVFRDVVSFPVMLATVGAVLLIGTVLVQRRFPQLVRRLDADRPGWTPEVTGNWVTVTGAVAIALMLYVAGAVDAEGRLEEQRFRERIWRLRSYNEAKWGPQRGAKRGGVAPVPPARSEERPNEERR